MTDGSQQPQRRNTLRHPSHDYTRAGAYFVTICAQHGHSLFGRIVDDAMILNALGQIADRCWIELVNRRADIQGDIHVVMPNHVHLLLWLQSDPASTTRTDPRPERTFANPIAGSLSTLIGSYKSVVTQQAKRQGLIPAPPLWQRNFYDRIVRSERELRHIREYITANPARWIEDQLHPQAPPNQFNRTWQNP